MKDIGKWNIPDPIRLMGHVKPVSSFILGVNYENTI